MIRCHRRFALVELIFSLTPINLSPSSRRLAAISIERVLDTSRVSIRQCYRSPKISATFRCQSCGQVACASKTVHGLASRRQAESFLDSLVGFHLVSHDLFNNPLFIRCFGGERAEDSGSAAFCKVLTALNLPQIGVVSPSS
jgi:hypothetical protein